MIGKLDNCDFKSGIRKIFSHLNTDISAANDNCFFRSFIFNKALYLHCVGDISQGENVRLVYALDVRTYRLCTGGKDQLVVAFLIYLARINPAYLHDMLFGNDLNSLVFNANIYIKSTAEALGSLQSKHSLVGDLTADIIRQTAIHKGDKISTF